MRIGQRGTKRRLTGLTLPTVLGTGGGGATWAAEPGEKELAASILRYLEDRRVLYNPYDAESPRACAESVREVRGHLRDVIEQCHTSELRDPLRAIQAACRQFLTEAETVAGSNGRIVTSLLGGPSSWLFNQALGSFRAHVGVSVAVIIKTFDVAIDEHLAKILPPPLDGDDGKADPCK
jgi:uncharacterized protein DUF6650